jgi:tetratricopeptide (TPR) repeat protein
MGNDPRKPSRVSFLSRDEARFAALLAVVAAVAISVIVTRRPAGLALGRPLATVAERVKRRHLVHAAARLDQACKRHDCNCALIATGVALDADAGEAARELLKAAEHCSDAPARDGLRAEAFVQDGRKDGAELAARTLRTRPREPHALQALGLAAYRAGSLRQANAAAGWAIAAGRGAAAHVLLGVILYAQNELGQARSELGAALAVEPEDTVALYNLALVAGREDHYGEARSLYLRVLALDPKHKEARFNLGVMTHAIGAEAEARNHLKKLEAIAPGDPLVSELKTALDKPAHPRGPILTVGGKGAPPP